MRFLEPLEHDSMMAGVSHLPFIASTVLTQVVEGNAAWDDMAKVSGSGLRDMTRLAEGSPEMYRDICLTNSEMITRWLADYITALNVLRERIATRDSTLIDVFSQAQKLRRDWQASLESPRNE